MQDYEPSDPKTHKGLDLTRMTMADLYKHFDLQEDTTDFIGHALALHVGHRDREGTHVKRAETWKAMDAVRQRLRR